MRNIENRPSGLNPDVFFAPDDAFREFDGFRGAKIDRRTFLQLALCLLAGCGSDGSEPVSQTLPTATDGAIDVPPQATPSIVVETLTPEAPRPTPVAEATATLPAQEFPSFSTFPSHETIVNIQQSVVTDYPADLIGSELEDKSAHSDYIYGYDQVKIAIVGFSGAKILLSVNSQENSSHFRWALFAETSDGKPIWMRVITGQDENNQPTYRYMARPFALDDHLANYEIVSIDPLAPGLRTQNEWYGEWMVTKFYNPDGTLHSYFNQAIGEMVPAELLPEIDVAEPDEEIIALFNEHYSFNKIASEEMMEKVVAGYYGVENFEAHRVVRLGDGDMYVLFKMPGGEHTLAAARVNPEGEIVSVTPAIYSETFTDFSGQEVRGFPVLILSELDRDFKPLGKDNPQQWTDNYVAATNLAVMMVMMGNRLPGRYSGDQRVDLYEWWQRGEIAELVMVENLEMLAEAQGGNTPTHIDDKSNRLHGLNLVDGHVIVQLTNKNIVNPAARTKVTAGGDVDITMESPAWNSTYNTQYVWSHERPVGGIFTLLLRRGVVGNNSNFLSPYYNYEPNRIRSSTHASHDLTGRVVSLMCRGEEAPAPNSFWSYRRHYPSYYLRGDVSTAHSSGFVVPSSELVNPGQIECESGSMPLIYGN